MFRQSAGKLFAHCGAGEDLFQGGELCAHSGDDVLEGEKADDDNGQKQDAAYC